MLLKTLLNQKKTLNTGRRRTIEFALKTMALLPFAGLIEIPPVFAEDLPHVTEDDAMAKALKYVADAKTTERPEKAGTPGDQQTCLNCQFLVAGDGEWRGCQLFPGKSVHIGGWCINWTLKA